VRNCNDWRRYWNHADLAPFRSFVAVVSIICGAVFIFSFVALKSSFLNAPSAKASSHDLRVCGVPQFATVVKQLVRSKNFMCYVGFSALQVFEYVRGSFPQYIFVTI
jgi:hypothetical protein